MRRCFESALLLLSVMRTDGGQNEAAGSLELRPPSYCMCQGESLFILSDAELHAYRLSAHSRILN